MTPDERRLRRQIRFLLAVFIVGLLLSGATAIPLEPEIRLVIQQLGPRPSGPATSLSDWLWQVYDAVSDTNARHPFLAYGMDWLAFGHFAIAVAFIGPWRDPVKNRWVIEFGMIASALVIPYAAVFGYFRGIPWGWRAIDASFGIGGMLPLWLCWRRIRRIEALSVGGDPRGKPD